MWSSFKQHRRLYRKLHKKQLARKEPRMDKETRHAMDKHHRLPRSRGGSNAARNISVVEKRLHSAWHRLVGNMNAQEVAAMLSKTWIDPDYYLVAIPRKRPRKSKGKPK